MKKIVSIILLFTLVFSCFALWGCNYNKSRVPLRDFFDEYVIFDSVFVTVKCDEAILPASFFGEKIVKEIIKYYDYDNDTQTRKYYLELNSKDVFGLIYCTRKIESIPDVVSVSLTYGLEPFKTPDDLYYTNSNQWGLERINIERVWDFSKGVNKINVGVIDSGVYSHDDLPNGIIVLVDEDIEAYENGTLVFYDNGNVPQMQ